MFAPGVAGSMADNFPDVFRKDILLHEAHRHPYMEVLGAMYMIKLKHKGFATRAGNCYRLIFAMALMPWLRKFRVMARSRVLLKHEGAGRADTADHTSVLVRNVGKSGARLSSHIQGSILLASMAGSMRLKSVNAHHLQEGERNEASIGILQSQQHSSRAVSALREKVDALESQLGDVQRLSKNREEELLAENSSLKKRTSQKSELATDLAEQLQRCRDRIGELTEELERRRKA
uniref:Uncharacterized protein n=1 Tax=Pseudictyota dubia TaxID=2749911 RepID=A0A7R9Z0D4_9STRA